MVRDVERKLEEWVATQAWAQYAVPSLHLHMSGDTGWPDRVFFIAGGRPLFIEFKEGQEVPGPKQKLKHAVLTYRGYDVQIHNDKTEALAAIQRATATANAQNDGGGSVPTPRHPQKVGASRLPKTGG